MLRGDIDRRMMVADRTGQTGNEAGGYGKRLRVGLHFTQANLPGSLSKWHSDSVPFDHPVVKHGL